MAVLAKQEGRVVVPICCPRHPKLHQTKPRGGREGTQRTEGLLRGSRIRKKKNKTDSGGEQKEKRGLLSHAILRKNSIIFVTQGQEVKPRIIIMKTVCLHHLMLLEIPRSKSKVENPSASAAGWNCEGGGGMKGWRIASFPAPKTGG